VPGKTVKELREMARDEGLSGYSNLRKAGLIDMIDTKYKKAEINSWSRAKSRVREKLFTKYLGIPAVLFLAIAMTIGGVTGYMVYTSSESGTPVRNPATAATLVEKGSVVLSVDPPTAKSENADQWFTIGVNAKNTTDFEVMENLVLSYDRYVYIQPASGKDHWVLKWKDVNAWKRKDVVIHARSEVHFDVPLALPEGWYVFTLWVTDNYDAVTLG